MTEVKPNMQRPAMVIATLVEFVTVALAMLVFFTTGKIWISAMLVVLGGLGIAFTIWRDRKDQGKRVG